LCANFGCFLIATLIRAKFLAKRRKIADKLTKFVLKIYPDYSFVKSANLAFQSDFKHENLMIFGSAIL